MVRLIDADAIEHCLVIGGRRHGKTIISEIIYRAIQAAPTVDAVPVIRCKDCKFSHITADGLLNKYCDNMTDDDGNKVELYVESTFYCGWAERRTDETD